MSTMATYSRRDTGPGTAALVAGISLLVMAVVAAVANFAVIANLAVPGDATATAANLGESAASVRLAAAAFIITAILDVIVAWALYIVFRTVNPSLALLGGWLRLAYAAILAVAVGGLLNALRASAMDSALAAFLLDGFDSLWQVGLIVFGAHLVVVGWLAWRADFCHWIFGLLLIISGLGYTVDGFGTVLSPDYAGSLALFTFVGEVIFIFWLLIRGSRLPNMPRST